MVKSSLLLSSPMTASRELRPKEIEGVPETTAPDPPAPQAMCSPSLNSRPGATEAAALARLLGELVSELGPQQE